MQWDLLLMINSILLIQMVHLISLSVTKMLENIEPQKADFVKNEPDDIQLEKTELEKKYPLIDFGDEFNDAKKELYAFENSTIYLKALVDDPSYFLSDYFIGLRIQLDLEREMSKKLIDDKFDELIKEIADLENECITNKITEKYEEKIKVFETDIKRINDELNIPKIDVSKWGRLKFESMNKLSEINYIIENHQNYLLNDQDLSIQSIQDELEAIFNGIGIIQNDTATSTIKSVPISDCFRICLGDFDTIEIENNELMTGSYNLDNTDWYSVFKNKGGELIWFLNLSTLMAEKEYVNIETEIEFRMISMGSDIDFFKKFSKNFSGDDHYTKKYIMNIKKLLETSYYDKVNNCIYCDIKIIIKAKETKDIIDHTVNGTESESETE